jgi:hypothetical protein
MVVDGIDDVMELVDGWMEQEMSLLLLLFLDTQVWGEEDGWLGWG